MTQKPLLVLFDAHALIHRAFHAIPPLILKNGQHTNAVFGFAGMLLKTLNNLKPTHVAVAFDSPGPTFRHEQYKEYKAHRPKTPEELTSQFATVRELVEAFNIPAFALTGYEADDLLGTLGRQASDKDIDTIIVTGDTDMLQLVSEHVRVMMPKPRRSFNDTIVYDEAGVEERYSLSASQIADLKGLKGDPSDNIKGVPGVGDKTATKLLQQFGSVDGIYEKIEEVEPLRIKQKLIDNKDEALLSKKLTTIITDAPVELDLDACHLHSYDRENVVQLFRKLEFNSLVSKLPLSTTPDEKPPAQTEEVSTNDYRIINTKEALSALIIEMREAKIFAFDTETTGLDTMQAALVGLSLSAKEGVAYYIPVGHQTGEQLDINLVINTVKPLFDNTNTVKIAHNAKYDMAMLANYGIEVKNLSFDTMIAAYLLGDKPIGLKSLAFSKLNIEMTPITQLIGTGAKQISMDQVDINDSFAYACADADITFRLYQIFKDELKKHELVKLFEEVEMPLVSVLMSMERYGVALNADYLIDLSSELQKQLLDLEAQIHELSNNDFNVNSPAQLAVVLFDELGLPNPKKRSTDAKVLEELKDLHPIVNLMLQYRHFAKLKSTYADALPALVNPKTGRIHTNFNQTLAATGRLSSNNPNLQNIPVGRQIRQAFAPREGCLFLSADYSQIELRVMAHLSQDTSLMTAFANNEDIHTQTAAEIFGVAKECVNPDMRRVAKVINFGVLYGMSAYGLQQATDLSREDANKFINAYFEKYPGVKNYTQATITEAEDKGYVQTILGRRRYIPEITHSNHQIRTEAQRMATNMPVQGTAADIVKIAMITIQNRINELELKTKMLLQVHDELVFEVPHSELMEIRGIIQELMPSAIKLSVPVKVDIKIGNNWGEMERS
ncbi:MAG: DNA polymerase I [Chloroflexi bacterium]|jgi:DNA polymerase I|nr:DNA polymerase I [Chloroflexota bacterium]MBT7081399.1 DNA polymerase I [Chloroflexota bacterium]